MGKIEREMSQEVRALFELVKGGLHREYIPEAAIFEGVKWSLIVKLAMQQTVLGIAWDGMLKLSSELMPASQIKLQWYSYVIRIEKSNAHLNSVAAKIYSAFRTSGYAEKVVMVKGQAIARLYPTPSHRQCGDIDLYTSPEYFDEVKRILEEMAGVESSSGHPIHVDVEVDGVIIELHYKLLDLYSRKKRKSFEGALQSWYPSSGESLEIDNERICTPPTPFNEAYVLLHLYKHLILYGVGLRQVIDWCWSYRLLSSDDVILPEYGKIRTLFSSLAVKHLGFSCSELPAYSSNTSDKRVDKMVSVILSDGNFGQNDTQRLKYKKSSFLVRKFHSFRHLVSRWFRVWRILPGDVLEYMLGFLANTFTGIFTGKIRH